MAATPLRPQDPGERPDDLREVVAVARTVVSQEWLRLERLENKARQQVVVAGQWFAIAQAVLAVALNSDGVNHRWLLWLGGLLGLGAGAAVVFTFVLSWKVWRVSDKDHEVTPQGLMQMRDYAHRPDQGVLDDLIQYHANILQNRRKANDVRADDLHRAEIAWLVAMGLPLVELAFALAAILVP